MKVWILDSGCYSDHHLVGVFSSEEKAMEAKARRKNLDDHDPWETEVDGVLAHEHGPSFRHNIEKATGDTSYAGECPPHSRHPRNAIVDQTDRHIFVESPISAEHAAKVAAEKRQEWLRKNAATDFPR